MSLIFSHVFPYRSLQHCCVFANKNTLLPGVILFCSICVEVVENLHICYETLVEAPFSLYGKKGTG